MNKKTCTQNGNIFFIILIAIGLFAAIAYTVMRSANSENTTVMTEREARLAGTDILNYAQSVERAVSRVRQKGISENDISFANNVVSGYEHSTPQENSHKVFHSRGGKGKWRSPADTYNDGSEWIITGNTCVANIGSGGSTCASDSINNEELLLILPNINQAICNGINIGMGVPSTPTDSGTGYSTTKFTGSFADGTSMILSAKRENGCFQRAGASHFFYVLLAR